MRAKRNQPPMLFHSTVRKELARSFGASLVVLVTIVMTMTLIRTLSLANRGSVNPEEVMMVMGELNRAGFNSISLVTNGSVTAP